MMDVEPGKRDPYMEQILAGIRLVLEEMREDRKEAAEDRRRADEDRRKADEDRRKADEDRRKADEDRLEAQRRFQELILRLDRDRKGFNVTLNAVMQVGLKIEGSLKELHQGQGKQTAVLQEIARRLKGPSNSKGRGNGR